MNHTGMSDKEFNLNIRGFTLDSSSDGEYPDYDPHINGWVSTKATDHLTVELMIGTELKNLGWVAQKNATFEEFKKEWIQNHREKWKNCNNDEVRIMVECRDAERNRCNTIENDKETSMMNNLHDVLSNCISPVTYMKLEQKMRQRPNVSIDDYNKLVEKAIRLELENKQRAMYIKELQDELIALKKEKMVK
tara:strand:- start:149 stop:724 length:576 start_codon:yes stop_codon:yes gene_type:complete